MPASSPRNSEGNLVAVETLVPGTVVTATGNISLGSGWSQAKGVKLQLVAASVTGTTPNYAIKVQDSADGTNFVDVPSGAFTAVTAASTQVLVFNPVLLQDYARLVLTVTGTTPSAALTLTATSVAHSNL